MQDALLDEWVNGRAINVKRIVISAAGPMEGVKGIVREKCE